MPITCMCKDGISQIVVLNTKVGAKTKNLM